MFRVLLPLEFKVRGKVQKRGGKISKTQNRTTERVRPTPGPFFTVTVIQRRTTGLLMKTCTGDMEVMRHIVGDDPQQ